MIMDKEIAVNSMMYNTSEQQQPFTHSWKESIYLQREHLARQLHAPLAQLAEQCLPLWEDRDALTAQLKAGFTHIPYCTYLYCVGTDCIQISENVGQEGIVSGHLGRDRSQRPYMKESVPSWGFLLSDAYISQMQHRPSLTALQVVHRNGCPLGYVGADFDLRDLPANAVLYEEPGYWRQIKGDPAIRGMVFQQSRVESPMDHKLEESLSILEELLTLRGVFQCQIHFASSQFTLWTVDDPYRYRIIDHEAALDADICLAYPVHTYPETAVIPQADMGRILNHLQTLRLTDQNLYLRMSSINIFNGMVSLTFSCDGTHYMRYDEFLDKSMSFWFGNSS